MRFVEHVAQSRPRKVDREAGIVYGVRVLGLTSANGREYSREAVARAASLYEGCPVNADHPSRPGEATPVARRLGWLQKVRVGSDGGLYADLHYLVSHPQAAALAEAAERNPRLMGLSHNVSGRTRREGGREIVEEIETVHSVDLVADPATVGGLFEGLAGRGGAGTRPVDPAPQGGRRSLARWLSKGG